MRWLLVGVRDNSSPQNCSGSSNRCAFGVSVLIAKRYMLSIAKCTVEALRREFAQDLAHEEVEHITLNLDVALLPIASFNCIALRSAGELC